VTEIRGRRHKQLLDGLKENISYWKLKEEALDCLIWRTGLETGSGPVVQATKYMDDACVRIAMELRYRSAYCFSEICRKCKVKRYWNILHQEGS
jgi:hypothetical protein